MLCVMRHYLRESKSKKTCHQKQDFAIVESENDYVVKSCEHNSLKRDNVR